MTIQLLQAAAENITLLPIPSARQRTKKVILFFYSKYKITTPGLLEGHLEFCNQLSLELALCSFMSTVAEF